MRYEFFAMAALAILAAGCEKNPGGEEPAHFDSKVLMTEINGTEDYVELYNSGTQPESLEGFKIRRMRMKDGEPDAQTIWKGTAGLKIAAGERLVLSYVEGNTDNAQYPRNLQNPVSGKKNLYMWLQDPEETKLSVIKRGEEGIGWGEVRMHKVEQGDVALSYALIGSAWKYALPTKGRENGEAVGSIDQTMITVSINEINLAKSQIELYNYGVVPVNLSGFELRWSRIKADGTADNMTIWTGSSSIDPKGFLLVNIPNPSLAGFTDKNIHIRLRDPESLDCTGEKIVWDDFKRGTEGRGWTLETLSNTTGSFARVPDGTGDWYLQDPSLGSRNGSSTSSPVPGVKVD